MKKLLGILFAGTLGLAGCVEFACEEYGNEVGQCLDRDFIFEDKYGEERSLHDSEGDVVLLNISAGFCENCHEESKDLPGLYSMYSEDEFDIYQPMVTGIFAWKEPDAEFLEYFEDLYGVEHTVVMDPEFETLYYFDIGAVPVNVFLYNSPGYGMYVEDILIGYNKNYIEQQVEYMVSR